LFILATGDLVSASLLDFFGNQWWNSFGSSAGYIFWRNEKRLAIHYKTVTVGWANWLNT